jgi:hypothetical protein
VEKGTRVEQATQSSCSSVCDLAVTHRQVSETRMAPERQREAQSAQVSEDIKRKVQLFERFEPLDCHPPTPLPFRPQFVRAAAFRCLLNLHLCVRGWNNSQRAIFSGMEGRKIGMCIKVCSMHLSQQCMTVCSVMQCLSASVTASFQIYP